MKPIQKIIMKSMIFFTCVLMGFIHSSCLHMTSNRIEFVTERKNYGATEYTFYNQDSTKAIIAVLSGKNQHLYYADLEKFEYEQITFGDNYNFDLYISPDDQFLAYASLDKRKGRNPKLKIMDLTNFENLDTSPVELEGWNPLIHDFNLYYTNYVHKNDIRKGANIFKYDIFERTLEQLTEGKIYDIVIDIDSKGEMLYFMRGTRYYFASPVGTYRWREYYYHKIDLSNGDTVQVNTEWIPASYQERISCNGKYALQYSIGRVYLVDLLNGNYDTILPMEEVLEYEIGFSSHEKVTNPIFHPHKEKIFFVMAGDHKQGSVYSRQNMTIYCLDYLSFELEQIGSFSSNFIRGISVSNDAKKFFFKTTLYENKGLLGMISYISHDLWLYDLEKDVLTQLNL